MLTEEENKEILKEVKHYPYPAVACIDALKIVQHHEGGSLMNQSGYCPDIDDVE
jgi:NADH:ubiquinone oxidoreductase subunit E